MSKKEKRIEKYEKLSKIEDNNYKSALERGELKYYCTVLEYCRKNNLNLKPQTRMLLGYNCKAIAVKLKTINKALPVYYKREFIPEGIEHARRYGYRKGKSRVWPIWLLDEVFFGGKR